LGLLPDPKEAKDVVPVGDVAVIKTTRELTDTRNRDSGRRCVGINIL
jgi:hypothetical protein